MANFIAEDIFQIKGIGVVVTGKVQDGIIKKGMISNLNGNTFEITQINKFRDQLEEANSGDEVGVGLKFVSGDINVDGGGFFQKLFNPNTEEYKYLKNFKGNQITFQ